MPRHDQKPFWETKSLHEMNHDEWESLCDHCGQCCLHKIEDVSSRSYICTNIACKLLDINHAGCMNYANRKQYVPDCVQLTPDQAHELGWLPKSCAYRRIADGKGLADWHPLISGNPDSVRQAGMSVRGKAISETLYKDEDHALDQWMAEGNTPLWVQPIKRTIKKLQTKS